jgi:hypothetical protein
MGKNRTSFYTARKQEDFRDVLKVDMTIARARINRTGGDGSFHYFDLNAASGAEDGHDGSPLIALRLASELRLPLKAWFFEEKIKKATLLEQNVRLFRQQHPDFEFDYRILSGDHTKTALPVLGLFEGSDPDYQSPDIYGMVYTDPYGIPPYDLLARFSRVPRLNKVDILIHLAGTAHKRRGYSPVHKDTRKASQLLILISKRRKLIREYDTSNQFTMAFCTNWTNIPDDIFAGNEFCDVESETGLRILQELDLSNADLKRQGIERHPRTRQLRLPLD